MKFSIPRGTFDLLPEGMKSGQKWRESSRWHFVEEQMRQLAFDYGYQEVRTPIFEYTSLFVRGIGEHSDIVSKEMYTFVDKGSRSLSLRPEGTASVMRAFVQGGMQSRGVFRKLFYMGPFFRYDRPQSGRYRQFHQFGAEMIGDPLPIRDFELIEMLCELYRRLNVKISPVKINSLGNAQSREAYVHHLRDYLSAHLDQLTPEGRKRAQNNPLRFLDSKDPKERELLKGAPSLLDFCDHESRLHFDILCGLLEKGNIPFCIDSQLVRGLDYYSRTVFEVDTEDLGAQNAVGGGGRYDGLLAKFGGSDLPSIGFAVGMERILSVMECQGCEIPPAPVPFVLFIPKGEQADQYVLSLLYRLRCQHIPSEMVAAKTLSKALQIANQLRARMAIVIGDRELEERRVCLKEMHSGAKSEVGISDLFSFLIQRWEEDGL